MSRATLHCGDVRAVLAALPTESVQCVVTSPPYWGLRDYGTAKWDGGDASCDHLGEPKRTQAGFNERYFGKAFDENKQGELRTPFSRACGKCQAVRVDNQLGLERTPEEYVANMVAVFREVRRVLRPDGVCWLNLGDSYNSGGGTVGGGKHSTLKGKIRELNYRETLDSLKPKDLVGIPWRVAFALQADGWWLRSDVIWAKPNPMPESVTDRPTRSHEYLFLLTKSERYFYDAQAIAEPATRADTSPASNGRLSIGGFTSKTREDFDGTRNARSVWTISTMPYPAAHFATFPEELARRCILAGSSPRACEHCGAPWERVTEREPDNTGYLNGPGGKKHRINPDRNESNSPGTLAEIARYSTTTTGWRPACSCECEGTGRCVVLDPFGGSGTVAQVATGNGRDSIYIDLNPKYLDLARQRIGPMFCGEVA